MVKSTGKCGKLKHIVIVFYRVLRYILQLEKSFASSGIKNGSLKFPQIMFLVRICQI